MSFLFDKLFQKQNPELASQMARRGLVFDKRRHRWVKGIQPDANVTGEEFSEIPGMEGPFRYKTGNTYYYSPKEGKYYDRGQDVFMPRGFDPHTGEYSQTIEDKPQPKSTSQSWGTPDSEIKLNGTTYKFEDIPEEIRPTEPNVTVEGIKYDVFAESTPESYEKSGKVNLAALLRKNNIVRSLTAKKPKGNALFNVDVYKNGKFKVRQLGK